MTSVQRMYEPRIAEARDLVSRAPILERLLSPELEGRPLLRFLIEYCSLGVQITEPVEDWIARAGKRCIEVGLVDVGKALCDHAAHEADHQLMFIEDTDHLVRRWNSQYSEQLDTHALIARRPTRAMLRYIDLHEETIASPLPFGQVAIELEIERLSITLVPSLLSQFSRVLGEEVIGALSFLSSHAALDVGHTHLNTRMMNQVLGHRPEAAEELARIGAEALFTYMSFFEECWTAAVGACTPHALLGPQVREEN